MAKCVIGAPSRAIKTGQPDDWSRPGRSEVIEKGVRVGANGPDADRTERSPEEGTERQQEAGLNALGRDLRFRDSRHMSLIQKVDMCGQTGSTALR